MNLLSATGRCLCGAVTFTATDVEAHFHICHCGMCRRQAGGPSMSVNVGEIAFTGGENILRYRSSEWAERGTCGKCGGNLFYRLTGPDKYMVSWGAFDDAAAFTLSEEIYVDHKPASYAFAGDHPRATEAEIVARYGG